MELPASVTALGEQLRGAGEIVPDPVLFSDADVFAAERERIFVRPSMAVDHASRLSKNTRYFRCDANPRSIIVAREQGGGLHALRNVCIHAGYPVCDADDGATERLICPYHGWEYALDGRLVEPVFSSRIDPSRLRLASYPVWVRNGVIFVDPSGATVAGERDTGAVPAWLADASVAGRAQYSTSWNWKYLRHFLRSSPHLLLDEAPDACREFGPLSFMLLQSRRAVLVRVIPKFTDQTDFQMIEIAAEGTDAAPTSDAVAEGLRRAATSLSWFDRDFAGWYCSLMLED